MDATLTTAYKMVNKNQVYCPKVNNDADWDYLFNTMNPANGSKDKWETFLKLFNDEYGCDIRKFKAEWIRVNGEIIKSFQINKKFWEKFIFISEHQRKTDHVFLNRTKIAAPKPETDIRGTFFSIDLSKAFDQAMVREGALEVGMDWTKIVSQYTDHQLIINSKGFRHECYNDITGFLDGLCVYFDYLTDIYNSNDPLIVELKERGAEPYAYFTDCIYLKIDSEDRFSDLCFKDTEINGYQVHTSTATKFDAIYNGVPYGVLTRNRSEKLYYLKDGQTKRDNMLHIFYKQEIGEPITDYDIALSKLQ